MQTNRLGGRTAKNIVRQAIDKDKLEERVEAVSGHRAGLACPHRVVRGES